METVLFYTSPAKNFCLGFPLGNGRIGAMLYGEPTKEYYSLNEETLWSGLPYQSNRCDSHLLASVFFGVIEKSHRKTFLGHARGKQCSKGETPFAVQKKALSVE